MALVRIALKPVSRKPWSLMLRTDTTYSWPSRAVFDLTAATKVDGYSPDRLGASRDRADRMVMSIPKPWRGCLSNPARALASEGSRSIIRATTSSNADSTRSISRSASASM